MSKDIWHNTEEIPKAFKTFVFKTDKGNICSDMVSTNNVWNPILLPEFYSMDDFDKAERITKWCYLDDLLALETENKDLSDKIGKTESDLERTRKALDVALDEINKIKVAAESVGIGFFMTAAISALVKINTALEQKE